MEHYKDSVDKNIGFKTSMLRSDLCNYSNAYIVMKERISVSGTNNASKRNKKLTFKNAPFRLFTSKINDTFVDNAEDLYIVMPLYNLLEYNDNYSMPSWSLRIYYRDEINDDENELDNNDRRNNNKTIKSKSFEYKTKIIEGSPNNSNILDAEIVIIQ